MLINLSVITDPLIISLGIYFSDGGRSELLPWLTVNHVCACAYQCPRWVSTNIIRKDLLWRFLRLNHAKLGGVCVSLYWMHVYVCKIVCAFVRAYVYVNMHVCIRVYVHFYMHNTNMQTILTCIHILICTCTLQDSYRSIYPNPPTLHQGQWEKMHQCQ